MARIKKDSSGTTEVTMTAEDRLNIIAEQNTCLAKRCNNLESQIKALNKALEIANKQVVTAKVDLNRVEHMRGELYSRTREQQTDIYELKAEVKALSAYAVELEKNNNVNKWDNNKYKDARTDYKILKHYFVDKWSIEDIMLDCKVTESYITFITSPYNGEEDDYEEE